MTVLGASAALACLTGFMMPILMLFGVVRSPPAEDIRPMALKYLGKWAFLTRWTNFICFVYYLVNLLAELGIARSLLRPVIIEGFPLVFSLGIFLTVAYYALVHFNPADRQRFKRLYDEGWRQGLENVYFQNHACHALALPASLLHARVVGLEGYRGTYWLVCVMGAYLTVITANRAATQFWVYPIQDQIEAKHGMPGALAFLVVLSAVLYSFAEIGFVLNDGSVEV
jgi:hypothetical protein